MEVNSLNSPFQKLLTLGERFCCSMEVATYLALVLEGGPKNLFLWHQHADQQTATSDVPDRYRASLRQCSDDLEFGLRLMRVWFQSGSNANERAKWAKQWRIDYQKIRHSIEPMRDRLLEHRFYNKSDDEWTRPLDLRLIPKVRLLFAHYLLEREREHLDTAITATIRGGSARQGQPPCIIKRASICYGRNETSFFYFSFDNVNVAHQVIRVSLEWLAWLKQQPRDEYDMAAFLIQKTRHASTVEVQKYADKLLPASNAARQETFLGHHLTTLLTEFATSGMEDRVTVKNHYIVCDINEPSKKDAFAAIRVGEEFPNAPITKIIPIENCVHIQLVRGVTGHLGLTGISGHYNNITDVTGIYLYNKLFVRVKRITNDPKGSTNDSKRHIELEALLLGVNPLEQYKQGQMVEGKVMSIYRNKVRVRIHPYLRNVSCNVINLHGRNLEQSFPPNLKVQVYITEINGDIIHGTITMP